MKSKKRLICSICAVFMIAFSLFLIPFSKVQNASAEGITPKTFKIETTVANGFQTVIGHPVKVFNTIFNLYSANTDYFSLSFTPYGLGYDDGGEYSDDIVDYLGPFDVRLNNGSGDVSYPSGSIDFARSSSGVLNSVNFRVRRSTSSSVFPYANYYFYFMYLDNADNNQVFNSDVRSIEYGGITRSSSYPNGAYGSNSSLAKEFPSSLITGGFTTGLLNKSYSWVRLYDNLGNSVVILVPFYATDDMALLPYNFLPRVVNVNNLTDNEIYQAGYNEGYDVGSIAGEETGYNIGYNEGFSNGETTGFGNGYNAGLETASETTFLGLIGATIDAPIKAFRGLFNFELLGVNMVSLITGLFTLCVIVCIVKLVLGGK